VVGLSACETSKRLACKRGREHLGHVSPASELEGCLQKGGRLRNSERRLFGRTCALSFWS